MLKYKKILPLLLLMTTLFAACKKDNEEVDTTYPVIDIAFAEAFPVQCSTVSRGQKFTFKAKISDNVQLGSLSIDIHHNFDHHTHSTEVQECQQEADKSPVNPFLLIREVPIPANLANYEVSYAIDVPAGIDAGDYHFMIRLTDKQGWQTIKGLSIKVI